MKSGPVQRYTLRPLAISLDLERVAAILSSYYTQPVTAEQLVEREAHAPANAVRSRVAAVDCDGRVAGCSDCVHFPFMPPGNFAIDIAVDLEVRRNGIGSQLFAAARAFAVSHGASRLEGEVQDRDPAWLNFAQSCGFRIDRHAIESRLELAEFDEQAFAGIIETIRQAGIRLFTLAEAGNTVANQHKLYELSRRNSFDIPGHEGAFPTFEAYRAAEFEASFFRAEGHFIAADGDEWIGQTIVSYYEATNSTYTQHTGVDRAYRGRGIALALKLLGIEWGRRIGATYTRTHNDEENTAILAINRRLGFRPVGGYYRMLCDLNTQHRINDIVYE